MKSSFLQKSVLNVDTYSQRFLEPMQKVLFQHGLTDKIISKIKDASPNGLTHLWNSPKEQISRRRGTYTGTISISIHKYQYHIATT